MSKIPTDAGIDSTLGLMFDGYEFISKRCDRLQSDIFQTRILLEKMICLRGKEAAKVFYDTDKFSRRGAAPQRIQKTLLGRGGVQGLDDAAHRHRKQIFMALMSSEHMDQLRDLTLQQCHQYAQKWQHQPQVILFDEIEEILCRAVCRWSGVPLSEEEVEQRTRDLSLMIAGSGRIGPKHWQAVKARNRAEKWIAAILRDIRDHRLEVPENTAAYAFAWHRDLHDNLLSEDVAAVDLLNVLRPTVAIGRYIVFGALALHEHPECQPKIKAEDGEYARLFTQEVRRFYPFFPFAAACVRHQFEWEGYAFPEGVRVLLDLYGTNHDPQLWKQPERFWPERFSQWSENSFDFIPQGGGDHYSNHRCAGEWLTIRIMTAVLRFLVNDISYRVPPQDLSISLSAMPTAPNSRFVMSDVSLN